GSFMVSYSRARAEGVGFHASVGLAPRTERLVLIIIGIALAGLGFGAALIGAITIIAALTVATLFQRIWHVWRLAEQPRIAPVAGDAAEENAPRG
nr:CDP-alcohol phosphatidyltransferase family protein [Chloroflexota bacterium]